MMWSEYSVGGQQTQSNGFQNGVSQDAVNVAEYNHNAVFDDKTNGRKTRSYSSARDRSHA
eukprot:8828279-Lingulodinium_polyedra.AAC.1